MTVDELRAIQDREDLSDRHVVELREDGFTLAHTDHERTAARVTGARLEDCAIHGWLADCQGLLVLDVEPGVYLLRRHIPDSVQEDYGAEPYDLEPLVANAAETTRR